MSKTILITGATGKISSGIIAQLKGSEHRLLALVRNPEKAEELKRQGVELRVGDLEKPWTLGPAFAGADNLHVRNCGATSPYSMQVTFLERPEKLSDQA